MKHGPRSGGAFVRTRCESVPGRSGAAVRAAHGPHKSAPTSRAIGFAF
ncbi:hypothetical protein L1M68_00395 [Coxiella burnetii]|nr:hypothetical protein [Coxiella burnetii]MCF2092813.1 hypothetical protein [Coxiella burnetii]MCF2094991.1 hypothetical protein [Coxiella burnetii]MCF2096882.1 hypothetical protein [Coxiella burnetii]MCF2098929.1 hypothetical protein [Coxiella burnetii]MCF2100974.1 hypothetical protein [Coxiella burnetii]